MAGLIVLFWFVGGGIALRYLVSHSIIPPIAPYSGQVLFIGVMSCMYVLWDVVGELLSPYLTLH